MNKEDFIRFLQESGGLSNGDIVLISGLDLIEAQKEWGSMDPSKSVRISATEWYLWSDEITEVDLDDPYCLREIIIDFV